MRPRRPQRIHCDRHRSSPTRDRLRDVTQSVRSSVRAVQPIVASTADRASRMSSSGVRAARLRPRSGARRYGGAADAQSVESASHGGASTARFRRLSCRRGATRRARLDGVALARMLMGCVRPACTSRRRFVSASPEAPESDAISFAPMSPEPQAEDSGCGRVAVCERPAPHRPRGGLRRPSDTFARYHRMRGTTAGGERHGRARDAGHGGGGRRGRVAARHRRAVQPGYSRGSPRPRASYDLFTRTTTANHYRVTQDLFRTLHARATSSRRRHSGRSPPLPATRFPIATSRARARSAASRARAVTSATTVGTSSIPPT